MSVTPVTAVDFSVVIGSRNLPELVREALDSVLLQSHESVEIIVFNDGSDGEYEAAYDNLATEFEGRVSFVNCPASPKGRGPGHARNSGVAQANGTFVCFLDDDDCWTD